MELSFSTNGMLHTVTYVGDRPAKPGRWWYCADLEVYVEVPIDASEADVIAVLIPVADSQEVA